MISHLGNEIFHIPPREQFLLLHSQFEQTWINSYETWNINWTAINFSEFLKKFKEQMEIRPEAQIYVASFLKNLIVVFLKK